MLRLLGVRIVSLGLLRGGTRLVLTTTSVVAFFMNENTIDCGLEPTRKLLYSSCFLFLTNETFAANRPSHFISVN